MSVTKRDQLKLPKHKRPDIALKADTDVYLATYHYLKCEFQHARRHEQGIIRDDDEEFLHQYRVSLRRCRALIGLLHPLFEKQQKVMLKLALRTLMQHTNTLRDLDVFLMKMEEYFFLLEHCHHNGLTRFFDDLQDTRRKTFKQVKRWLKSNEYQQHCTLIDGLLDELKHAATANSAPKAAISSKTLAQTTLHHHYHRFTKRSEGIAATSPDHKLHQLRIEGKKFRYALEYFTPLYPKAQAKQQLLLLKQVQTSLGDLNDLAIQHTFLTNYLRTTQCMDMKKAALESLLEKANTHYGRLRAESLEQIAVFQAPEYVRVFKLFSEIK